MTTIESLVQDYLDRLDAATDDLPRDLRDDLRADVRAHLDEVTAEPASEADVRAALDRLGAPEAIAAAGRETLPDATPPPVQTGRGNSRALDVAAVLLLLIGGFVLPGLGWVIGVVLLWISSSWTTGEKLLGTLVWPGGFLVPLAVGLVGFTTGSCQTVSEIGPDGAETIISTSCPPGGSLLSILPAVLLALVTLAPIAVAILLLRRAEARRATAGGTTTTSGGRTVVTVIVIIAVVAVLALSLAGAGAVAWLRVS
jgi:hypothetical protein